MIKTILLVEDEAIIAMAQKQMIKRLGYNVITAITGKEAIQLAAGNSSIDLILMDIDLGKGMDGTEAAEIILKDHDIPVVFLSSHTELDVVEKTEKITSYGYVVKNSGETVLAASIKMAFRLHDARLKEQAKEEALRESEIRYRILADNSSDTIWTMRFDGTFTYHSPAVFRLRGYTPEEANQIPMHKTMTPASAELIRNIFESEYMKPPAERWAERRLELEMYRKDGSTVYTEVSVHGVCDADGNISGLQGSTRDITDRKRAEEESSISKGNLEAIIENTGDIIASYDRDLRLLAYNRACSDVYRNLFGIELHTGLRTIDLFPESQRGFWNANNTRALAGESFSVEFSLPAASSQMLTFESFFNPIRRDGEVAGFSTFTRDITERKQMVEELRLRNASLDSIIENIPNMLFLKDARDLRFLRYNHAGEELLGYSKSDLIGKTDYDFFPEEQADFFTQKDREVLHAKEAVDIPEEVIQTQFKGERILHTRKVPILNEKGEPEYLLGISEDITELKRARDIQQEKDELYSLIVEQAPEAILVYDLDRCAFIEANANAERLFACSREEILKDGPQRFYRQEQPDGQLVSESFNEHMKRCQNGEVLLFERVILNADGVEYICEVRLDKIPSMKRRIIRATYTDITEHKRVEEALKESESKFQFLAENMADVVFTLDLNLNTTYVSPSIEKILGFTPEERKVQKADQQLTPESQKLVFAQLKAELEKEKVTSEDPNRSRTIELEFYHKNGSIRNLETHIRALRDSKGSLTGFYGASHDITERKQAEEMLKESEERYRLLVESINVGVVISSMDGVVRHANSAAAKLTGHDSVEEFMLEPTLKRYADLADRDRFVKELIETGYVKDFEMRSVKKDGTVFWTYMNAVLMKGGYGPRDEIIAFITDITERKKSEEQIRKLLAEKELILKEVHHRLKNNMNTVYGLLTLQAGNIKDLQAISVLEDAANRVRSMMVLYDKLYRSDSVQNISVKDYLPSLVDEIIANFPNSKSVKVNKMIDDFVLDAKRLQPVGIIINELITNIMKYAFTGRDNGLITITASLKDTHAKFAVADNGLGIPESVDFQNSIGFGLQLVWMLTRELQGTIKIERGNGTKVLLGFDI